MIHGIHRNFSAPSAKFLAVGAISEFSYYSTPALINSIAKLPVGDEVLLTVLNQVLGQTIFVTGFILNDLPLLIKLHKDL